MKKPNQDQKYFKVHVAIDSQTVFVKAKNPSEARRKAIWKLSEKKLTSLIDKGGTYVDEI